MKRHLYSWIIAIALFLSFPYAIVTAGSSTPSISNETVERVMDEILSGEISSHSDVLAVAISQQSLPDTAGTFAINAQDPTNDNLTVIQAVETTQNTEHSETTLYAISSLLVTDNTGEPVTASTLTRQYMRNSGSISEYQIYAVHTMYVYSEVNSDINGFGGSNRIKLSHMATRVIYGSSLTMTTTLQQGYFPSYTMNESEQLSSVITNPSDNTNYAFYPSSPNWLIIGNQQDFYTQAILVCSNSKMLILRCSFDGLNPPAFNGTW